MTFEALGESELKPAWLSGAVHPISLRGMAGLLITALPQETFSDLALILLEAHRQDQEGCKPHRLQAMEALAQLSSPELDSFVDEPIVSVNPAASERQIAEDISQLVKQWTKERKLPERRDRSEKYAEYLQVWDLREPIHTQHFRWRLRRRSNGYWFADGRSNRRDAGRHSLGTKDRAEAIQTLHRLDGAIAVRFGLAPAPPAVADAAPLKLEEGRRLYEEYIRRPEITGGVRPSTQKRYRTVFDKFILFARGQGIDEWNRVTSQTLLAYASDLQKRGYAGKTLRNELTTLVQSHKWLLKEGHLTGVEPLRLTVRKVESDPAYCYTREQVEAMIEHCRKSADVRWLHPVIVGLACTGLRISELASLRWSDLNLAKGRISLTDESHRSLQTEERRQLKGRRSRSLPIHPQLAEVLQELPRRGKYVFYGPRGGRLKPDTVRNVLVREVIKPLAARFPTEDEEKGFQDGRVHSFRHCFASQCANDGIPERTLLVWLGHQSSDMLKIYYHLHDQEAQRQMAKVNLVGAAGKRPTG